MVSMIRTRLPDEPLSRLAVWARRVAVFSVPVVLLAIVIVRGGLLEIVPALATFGGALALAAVAILLALGAFVVIWQEGLRGAGHAVLAFLIGIAILAYPAYLAVRAYRLPAINDITTDPADPPRFEAIARLRSRDANPIAYAGLRAAELQRAAYPDIEPLLLNLPPQQAYETALGILTRRKWRIVDSRPPQPGRRDGLIEAVARTPIMGFRDDVVVRIRPAPGGARVDARSASRYGRSDLGANARRVRALLEDIDDAAGAEEEKPKKAAPPPPPPSRKAQAPGRR
jgi:uncharacterized protein (DUF1499 family)